MLRCQCLSVSARLCARARADVQPWCAPTRAALMTGRYPYNVGMNQYNHGVEEERSAVPSSFAMLPKILKQAPVPYATHMLGKWRVHT